MDVDHFSAQQSIQYRSVGNWASTVIDYFDSKTRLLAIASKEISEHFIGLVMLARVLLLLTASSMLVYREQKLFADI